MIYIPLSNMWNFGILFIYLFILEALEDITSNFGINLQHLNNRCKPSIPKKGTTTIGTIIANQTIKEA
jgi:hypothetical protein